MADYRFTLKHTSQSALLTFNPVCSASELQLLFPSAPASGITVVTVTHKTSHVEEEEVAAAATSESDLEQLQKVGAVEF